MITYPAKEDLKNYLKDTEFNGLKGEVVFEGKSKKTTAIERVHNEHLHRSSLVQETQVVPLIYSLVFIRG